MFRRQRGQVFFFVLFCFFFVFFCFCFFYYYFFTANILYISQNTTYLQIHTKLTAKNIQLTNTTGHYRSLTLLTNCTYKREKQKRSIFKIKKKKVRNTLIENIKERKSGRLKLESCSSESTTFWKEVLYKSRDKRTPFTKVLQKRIVFSCNKGF